MAQDTTVNYSMSGNANEGSDYTLSGRPDQVIIPTGRTSADVTLSALVDNLKEKNETATMTLQPGSGYQFGTTGKGKNKSKVPSATVTILDGR